MMPLVSDSWGPEEIEAINRVVKSGRYTMGEEVSRFEEAFKEYFNVKYAVMVNSGSSANLIATAALFFIKDRPLKRGDEVIVPALSWSTSYTPLIQYGLKLKFVDVEMDTFNIDVDELEKAIGKKTKAVLGVNLLGNPADLERIENICHDRRLYFIEDNCEAMGALINENYAGTFGDLNTFSFFYSHHISTMEGGMILTDDRELYEIALCLRAHGWTRNLPENSTLYKPSKNDFFESYRFILPGYNVRPTEFQGAIGSEQLKKLGKILEMRTKNARLFRELFSEDPRFFIQKEKYGASSWFNFAIVLNPYFRFSREEIMIRLKNKGFDYRMVSGGNFLRQDCIEHADYVVKGKITVANLIHDRGLAIGNHPKDLTKELTLLHQTLASLL